MTTVQLDTHVLHWWSAEPDRVSPAAAAIIDRADELAVAAVTWYELGWLATHGRIALSVAVPTWLGRLAGHVRTVGLTPAIAATAVALPASFPGDPADRMIYATAVEHGWPLVTKDRRLRDHPYPAGLTVW